MNSERSVSVPGAPARARGAAPPSPVLLEALAALSGARELVAAWRIGAEAARELAEADAAAVVLRDGESCHFAAEHTDRPLWLGRRVPLRDHPAGRSILEGRELRVDDVEREPPGVRLLHHAGNLRSLAVVPFAPEPIGALAVHWADTGRAGEADLAPLHTLAEALCASTANIRRVEELQKHLGLASAELEQAREHIRSLSVTDAMTGLANRKGFHILAEHGLTHSSRRGLPCLAVKLDIDGLARVNERLGDEAGDALVAEVASILRQTFRASDIIGRTDGNEFSLLVLDPGDDATVIRRRIQERVAQVNQRGRGAPLALNIGIACSDPDDPAPLDVLLARASAALHSGKHGRTRRAT